METILTEIDQEIARLEQVKAYLSGRGSVTVMPSASPTKRSRRKMSAEARKRISEAQRARWAAKRKKAA